MYFRFIMQEALSQLRSYGITAWILLSFIYFILLASASCSYNSKLLIGAYGTSNEAEAFFSPNASLDEIQYFASSLQAEPWVKSIRIRTAQEVLAGAGSQINFSSISTIVADLLPTLYVEGKPEHLNEMSSMIANSNQYDFLEEWVVQSGMSSSVAKVLELFQNATFYLLLISILLTLLVGWVLLRLMSQKRLEETGILKSIGASSWFVLLPYLIFIMLVQPLAFLTGGLFTKSLEIIVFKQLQSISWAGELPKILTPLTSTFFTATWCLSLITLLALYTFAGWRDLKPRPIKSTLLGVGLLLISSQSLANMPPLNNLHYKTQRIENEIALIENHFKKIKDRTRVLVGENKQAEKSLKILAKELHKNSVRIKNGWASDKKSDGVSLQSLIKVQGSLGIYIKQHLDSVRQNRRELAQLNRDLRRRKNRLHSLQENLMNSIEEALMSPEQDKKQFAQLRSEAIKNLQASLSLDIFKTLYFAKPENVTSPIDGEIVFLHHDALIGSVVIVAHDPLTHFVFSGLKKTQVALNDKVGAGTPLGSAPRGKVHLDVRFQNQSIQANQILKKGS